MAKKIIVFAAVLLAVSAGAVWGLFKVYEHEIMSRYFQTEKQKNIGIFTLHYNKGDEKKAAAIEEVYPEIEKLERQWFNNGKERLEKADLHIYLADRRTDKDAEYDNPGFYLNKGLHFLYLSNEMTGTELLNVFSHEMAHFYLVAYRKQTGTDHHDIPLWLHEGAGMSFAKRIAPGQISEYAAEGVPLMEIKKKVLTGELQGITEEEYTLAMYAVEYLIYHHGETVVAELVKDTADGEFQEAFEKLTGENVDTLHEKIADYAKTEEIISLKGEEREQKVRSYLKERGYYFNGVVMMLSGLGEIYIEQGNYKKALPLYERKLEFTDRPSIYKQVSKVAEHVDMKKSIHYAEESVKSAKLHKWNVKVFEKFLDKQKKKLND